MANCNDVGAQEAGLVEEPPIAFAQFLAGAKATPEQILRNQMLPVTIKKWLSKLATRVKRGEISEDAMFVIIKGWASKNLTEKGQNRIIDMALCHLECQRIPFGALKDVVKLAKRFLAEIRNATKFPKWVSPENRILYVSMLIVGAYGRRFQFACNAVGAEAGVNSGTVHRFLNKCVRSHLISRPVQGHSWGAASEFELNDNLAGAWEDLGLALSDVSSRTGAAIMNALPYFFDFQSRANQRARDAYLRKHKESVLAVHRSAGSRLH